VKRTSADVKAILGELELDGFSYREFFREARSSQHADRWTLLSETNRVLSGNRHRVLQHEPHAAVASWRRDIEAPYDKGGRRVTAKFSPLLDATRDYTRSKQREDARR